MPTSATLDEIVWETEKAVCWRGTRCKALLVAMRSGKIRVNSVAVSLAIDLQSSLFLSRLAVRALFDPKPVLDEWSRQ